jgi:hypothetical protein
VSLSPRAARGGGWGSAVQGYLMGLAWMRWIRQHKSQVIVMSAVFVFMFCRCCAVHTAIAGRIRWFHQVPPALAMGCVGDEHQRTSAAGG